jgi:uncharacterized membrane protein YccC
MRALVRRYVQYRAGSGFWTLAAWNGGSWFLMMMVWDLFSHGEPNDPLLARLFGTLVSAILFGLVMGGFEINFRSAVRSGREPKP